MAELHRRASQWYEDNSLTIEAFHHAVAANDIERAERLIEGKGMPLQFRGAVISVLNWLESLPRTTLDARPSLWVTYASTLSLADNKQPSKRNYKLLKQPCKRHEPDDKTRDLVGHIAAMRATMAVPQHDGETMHCPVASCPGVSAPQ